MPWDAKEVLKSISVVRGIEWVLWPREMEIIYAERPVWNDLYGNLTPYYGELKSLLERRGTAAAEAVFPVHAMRILAYQGKREGLLTLYRIDSSEESF